MCMSCKYKKNKWATFTEILPSTGLLWQIWWVQDIFLPDYLLVQCKPSQAGRRWKFTISALSDIITTLSHKLLLTLLPLLYMASRHSRWYMWPHLPSLPTSSGLMPLCCRTPSYPDDMTSLSMQMVQSWNSSSKGFTCHCVCTSMGKLGDVSLDSWQWQVTGCIRMFELKTFVHLFLPHLG